MIWIKIAIVGFGIADRQNTVPMRAVCTSRRHSSGAPDPFLRGSLAIFRLLVAVSNSGYFFVVVPAVVGKTSSVGSTSRTRQASEKR